MLVYAVPLLILGVSLIVAGITGKPVEVGNNKVPVAEKVWQRVVLGVLGAGLVSAGVLQLPQTSGTPNPRPSQSVDPTLTPTPSLTVSTPPVSVTPSPPSSSSCTKELAITAPANGTKIAKGGDGLEVDVTACGLQPGQTGWLFDYDTGDGTYNLDGGGPLITSNGVASFQNKPIGNQGDVNKDTRITLVLADTACSQALSALNLQSTGTGLTSFPAGCAIADQVDVYVTYP